MSKQSPIAFLIAALLAGAGFTNTATAALVLEEPLAREAAEGPRGEGGKKGGHLAIEVKEQLARRGADDTQPDDRGGRNGGHGSDD